MKKLNTRKENPVAGRSRKSPSEQASSLARSSLSRHTPSSWTVLAAFIIVLILFLWLHFVLALQVASTGRQIQIGTEELQEQVRANEAIQRDIAEAESPRAMATRARDLGYGPQTPVYLPLSRPVSQPGDGTGATVRSTAVEDSSPSMWDTLADGVSTWAQAKNTP